MDEPTSIDLEGAMRHVIWREVGSGEAVAPPDNWDHCRGDDGRLHWGCLAVTARQRDAVTLMRLRREASSRGEPSRGD